MLIENKNIFGRSVGWKQLKVNMQAILRIKRGRKKKKKKPNFVCFVLLCNHEIETTKSP
jgi:hypothetical protein